MAKVSDFLDEVNRLFGFYFDAGMAFGFAKERLKSVQNRLNVTDASDFMFGQGEPQGTPDEVMQKSIHATTLGAVKARLTKDGADTQIAAQAMIVFTFHIWEEKYRTALTTNAGKPLPQPVASDVMGDLRLIRNAIIHNKGIADTAVGRCTVLKHFQPGQAIVFSDSIIYDIIRAIRGEFESRA